MIKCEICGKEMLVVNYLHLRRHKISTDEYRVAYPNAVLVDEETRKKVSESVREQHANGGKVCGFKKYMEEHGEEHKEYMSGVIKEQYASGKRDRGIGRKVNWSEKGMESLKVQGKRLGDSNAGRKHTEESVEKRAVKIRGKSYEELMGEERAKELKEDRKKCFDWVKERGLEKEAATRGSMAHRKKMEEDEDYRRNYFNRCSEACNREPNLIEQYLGEVIDSICPNEWKYVGDGKLLIEGLSPDFININGKKKIIELFGDYWHSHKCVGRTKEEEESQRVNKFAQYGYETLIIWENEIRNNIDSVKNKIREYTGRIVT